METFDSRGGQLEMVTSDVLHVISLIFMKGSPVFTVSVKVSWYSQRTKITYQKDPTYFRFKRILFVEKIYLLLRMIWKVDFKVIKSALVASEFYGAFIVGIGM